MAKRGSRVVVTLDGDFATLLATSGATLPSVMHLRIQGLGRESAVALLCDVVPRIERDLRQGCIASVGEDSVRLRSLPVGSP